MNRGFNIFNCVKTTLEQDVCAIKLALAPANSSAEIKIVLEYSLSINEVSAGKSRLDTYQNPNFKSWP